MSDDTPVETVESLRDEIIEAMSWSESLDEGRRGDEWAANLLDRYVKQAALSSDYGKAKPLAADEPDHSELISEIQDVKYALMATNAAPLTLIGRACLTLKTSTWPDWVSTPDPTLISDLREAAHKLSFTDTQSAAVLSRAADTLAVA